MPLWSENSRVIFVITGIVFLLVILLEVLVFFASPVYLNDDLGFSILLDWATSSETNWNYYSLTLLGFIGSILGILTTFSMGYDLRRSRGLKIVMIIIPSIIGFSVVFYSFFTLLEIPFQMVPYFGERTPESAIPGIMHHANGIVYTSIAIFSFGLILVLPMVVGFLFVTERKTSPKYAKGLLGIGAVFPAIGIIVAIIAPILIVNISMAISASIWAIMTFIPLALFSVWLIIQGATGGTSIDTEPIARSDDSQIQAEND